MSKTLILIPTYNEYRNVKEIASRILDLKIEVDILFIDDNSPDGTGKAIDELSSIHTNVFAIHRLGKLGIGSAHLEGIKWAYTRKYTTLVTMDCDFTHDPRDIPTFLEASRYSDIVVGSRYILQGSLPNWTLYRKLLTYLGHLLTRTVLGIKFDATGAFRVYRLDKIDLFAFNLIKSTSYSFFFESLFALSKNNYTVTEIPIILSSRTYGNSKMRISDIISSLSKLTSIFTTTKLNRNKYKIGPKNLNTQSLPNNQNDSWETYWVKSKSPIYWFYSFIASCYRRFLIKRNLNNLISKQYPNKSLLLHAGCGSGQVDTDVSIKHQVVALDLSKEALKLYDLIHEKNGHMTRGTIFSLPFQKESFDGIYHLGVLEHFTVGEIQECLLEFKRVLKQDGTMIVFWPPSFGLSVKFLGLSHFILNRLFKMKVKLHPDEITLLKSKRQAASIMSKAGFKIENYYFGIQDFFTYCMIVVTKDPDSKTG